MDRDRVLKFPSFDHHPLGSAIASAVQAQAQAFARKKLSVELDIADEARYVDCSAAIELALADLILQATARSPVGGEINICAVMTSRGLEIEVADEGPQPTEGLERAGHFGQTGVDAPSMSMFQKIAFDRQNLQLFCGRVPQGGMAWTLLARQRSAALKAA